MTDEERVRYLWLTAVRAAHTHDARGQSDPDKCAVCGLDIHLHLSTAETPEWRFTAEVLAALADVRREEREKAKELRQAVSGVWQAIRDKGFTRKQLAERDWNPDAHVEITLTIAECRRIADAIRKGDDRG